jgi:hypothetical protein
MKVAGKCVIGRDRQDFAADGGSTLVAERERAWGAWFWVAWGVNGRMWA